MRIVLEVEVGTISLCADKNSDRVHGLAIYLVWVLTDIEAYN